jgi:hypothetical protein
MQVMALQVGHLLAQGASCTCSSPVGSCLAVVRLPDVLLLAAGHRSEALVPDATEAHGHAGARRVGHIALRRDGSSSSRSQHAHAAVAVHYGWHMLVVPELHRPHTHVVRHMCWPALQHQAEQPTSCSALVAAHPAVLVAAHPAVPWWEHMVLAPHRPTHLALHSKAREAELLRQRLACVHPP